MDIANITNAVASKAGNSTSSAPIKVPETGKMDFLKLLIAKLTNQNPLDAQKDEDFIAQLASFETLNQTSELNKNLESFLMKQDLTQSSNLIGKIVNYDELGSDGETVTEQSGQVEAIIVSEGKTMARVNNTLIEIDKIKGIWNS